MPELPEVETLRRSLEPFILNEKIVSVDVRDTRLRRPVIPDDFLRWVDGRQIVRLARRSKYLIWHLDNEAAVVIHLGMSGRIGLFEHNDPVEKHTHILFNLAHKKQARFRDPRRFGLVEVVQPGALNEYGRFQNLGVEPLSDDFCVTDMAEHVKFSKKPIKNWIMDAQNIVGVGNIYANEALFNAGIHPTRPANSLTNDEQHRLVQSVKSVLTAAIEKGGTTLNDFRDATSEPGFFQLDLCVYHKAGESCLTCGSTIERIVLSGRSTFYCPSCQI